MHETGKYTGVSRHAVLQLGGELMFRKGRRVTCMHVMVKRGCKATHIRALADKAYPDLPEEARDR